MTHAELAEVLRARCERLEAELAKTVKDVPRSNSPVDDFRWSQHLTASVDTNFHACMLAAIAMSEPQHQAPLKAAFPELVAEWEARWHSPDGTLDKETE